MLKNPGTANGEQKQVTTNVDTLTVLWMNRVSRLCDLLLSLFMAVAATLLCARPFSITRKHSVRLLTEAWWAPSRNTPFFTSGEDREGEHMESEWTDKR